MDGKTPSVLLIKKQVIWRNNLSQHRYKRTTAILSRLDVRAIDSESSAAKISSIVIKIYDGRNKI